MEYTEAPRIRQGHAETYTSASNPGCRGKFAPVSVVIPCFGSASTIERAVASIAAQTRPPVEVIVVDDGNTDNVRRMLSSVQQKYGGTWLKIVSLPNNHGPGGARNAGWGAAREDLVAFLDADDSWHPSKLEVQVAFMERHPEIHLSGHPIARGDTGIGIAVTVVPLETTWEEVTATMLLLSNRLTPSAVIVRRLVALRFASGKRYMEDHLLWLEMAYSGFRLAILDAPLAYKFKPLFGVFGLSANLWQMEKGELDNYWKLHKAGHLNFPATVTFLAYSCLKFLRRVGLAPLHRWRANRKF